MRRKYPFRDLRIGEVRVIETPQKNFSDYAYKVGERIGWKFSTQRVSANAFRVERVS